MITLKQLKYLTSLAEHRHFGRAAEACAVTQPALSMQIRELEKHLGVDLVEWRPGEVILTGTGAEVVRRAESVLAAARDLTDYARHAGRLLTGQLRLGVIPTLAPYVLPRVLPALQRRHAGLPERLAGDIVEQRILVIEVRVERRPVDGRPVGDILHAQGQLAEAVAAFREDFAISQRLVSIDPSNADWQRHLAIAHSKLGQAYQGMGNEENAQSSYRSAAEAMERAVAMSPGTVGWKQDLDNLKSWLSS